MKDQCREIQDSLPLLIDHPDSGTVSHLNICDDCRKAYEEMLFMQEMLTAAPITASPRRREENKARIRGKIFRLKMRRMLVTAASTAAAVVLVLFAINIRQTNDSSNYFVSDYEWIILNSAFEVSADDLSGDDILDYLAAAGEYSLPEAPDPRQIQNDKQ